MPAACASCGEWNVDRLAVDLDMAVGGRMHAGQQLHAGALAGAVLAEQRQHLAGAQFERRILEGDRAAEGLCGYAKNSAKQSATKSSLAPAARDASRYIGFLRRTGAKAS